MSNDAPTNGHPDDSLIPVAPVDYVHTAIERGVSRLLDEVVDQAITRIADKGERSLVRDGIATVLREELTARAEAEVRRTIALNGVSAPSTAGASFDAIDRGMNAAKQVQNLGFVEFTTGLINGTFDAVINATLKQMEGYAKLVADLAKTLAQFQAENVSDAQINAHLSTRYPDNQGGTTVRSDFTFIDTAADVASGTTEKKAKDKLIEVARAIVAGSITIKDAAQRLKLNSSDTGTGISLDVDASDTATATKFTTDQVTKIRVVVGLMLATSMVDQLRAMAREGMARIVITNGEIMSKLTFNVSATDEQREQQSRFNHSSFGASVRGGASWGWGSASASANYNQLNVNTMNESSFDSVTMSTEIIGQVKLQFKTETFPPVVTEA